MNSSQSKLILTPNSINEISPGLLSDRSKNRDKVALSENYHLTTCDDTIKDVYKELKDSILSISPKIIVKVNKYYIAFINKKNFIYLKTKRSKLDVNLNLKKGELNDPKHIAIDMSKSLRHNPCEYLIPVDAKSDLKYILTLIIQAYMKN